MIEIRPLASDAELQTCAAMMAVSEPWKTLGRDYDGCLASLQTRPAEIHLATDSDQILGFVMLMMHGALVGYIRILCVDPQTRGKGVGSLLLAFAEERIFRESPNVWLFVTSFNTRARALYERNGYETIGEVRDYLVRGYSEFLMRKTRGPLSEFRTSSS